MEVMVFTVAHKGSYDYINSLLGFLNNLDLGIKFGIMFRVSLSSNGERACTRCGLVDRASVVVVDNGAFEILSGKVLDTHQVSSYIHKIKDKWFAKYLLFLQNSIDNLDYFVLPDIPVHGRRFVDHSERLRRIKLTAQLHREFTELVEKEIGREALRKALAVAQGYEPYEYAHAYTLLMKQDILLDTATFTQHGYGLLDGVLGIGSVCVRKDTSPSKGLAENKARGTLVDLIDRLAETIHKPKHYFGLNMRAVKSRRDKIYSSDTAGHAFNFRYKWKTLLKCPRPDDLCYAKSMLYQVKVALGWDRPTFDSIYERFVTSLPEAVSHA